MLDQQHTPIIYENKPLNISPMAYVSLDQFPDGATIYLNTDDNTLIDHQISCYSQALQHAETFYRSVRFAGQVSRFLSWLSHQPAHLMDASEIINGEIIAYNFLGMKSVPINHIIASEKRFKDFDSAFDPLNDRDWNRWIDIAALMFLGIELPPVDLFQIDKNYIVHDGHNRISVARTLGQDSIAAFVTHLKFTA